MIITISQAKMFDELRKEYPHAEIISNVCRGQDLLVDLGNGEQCFIFEGDVSEPFYN